jgi:dolichol kinase
MKVRTREVLRKIAHVLIGTACIIGAYFVLQKQSAEVLDIVFAVAIGGLVLADVLIADYGWKLPFYHHLQRAHEEHGLHTATLALISSIIAYKVFALPVALASIGMLVYGDAAAAIAGIYSGSGKRKLSRTRVAAMLVVCVVVGWVVFGWIGAVMGIVATLAECFARKIDDAVTIPVFAGLAGQLLMNFFL